MDITAAETSALAVIKKDRSAYDETNTEHQLLIEKGLARVVPDSSISANPPYGQKLIIVTEKVNLALAEQ